MAASEKKKWSYFTLPLMVLDHFRLQTLTQPYIYWRIVRSFSLREKAKRLSYFSLCSEHRSPFPRLCPVFVEWRQGCTKTSLQTFPRLLRSIIFIQLLYVAPVCAKRLRVWAIIRCAVSIFHLFSPLCLVFLDWSQGCTKTSAQTFPRLLRSLIYIQLLYVAQGCAKK